MPVSYHKRHNFAHTSINQSLIKFVQQKQGFLQNMAFVTAERINCLFHELATRQKVLGNIGGLT